MKKKKNNNKELIINSLNDEFDNRGRKKYSKKELRNMVTLEDFILKYYNRYDFRIAFRKFLNSRSVGVRDCVFSGRFDNDIEIVKFLDEYRLDEIYLDEEVLSYDFYDYSSCDVNISFSCFDDEIDIEVYEYCLMGVI